MDHKIHKKNVLLSCSGGLDSMALLNFAHDLLKQSKIDSLRVIHFNHGTRESQLLEEKLVRSFCFERDISFICTHFKGLNHKSNFEKEARDKRKKALYREVEEGEWIWEAHHLDDSYEWSLMSRSRSSSIASSLGIACRSDRIIRPFMSVSKGQIKKYAQCAQIKWLDDPSNKDDIYDRNYCRLEIISKVSSKFPQYLKHYVAQANQHAHLMDKHQKKVRGYLSKKKSSDYCYYQLIKSEPIDSFMQELSEDIYSLSNKGRGSISEQLKKLSSMRQSGKEGPLLFSGGILAFSYPEQLILVKSNFVSKWKPETLSTEGLKSRTPVFICQDESSVSLKSLKIQEYLTCQNSPKLLTFMQWIKSQKPKSKLIKAYTL